MLGVEFENGAAGTDGSAAGWVEVQVKADEVDFREPGMGAEGWEGKPDWGQEWFGQGSGIWRVP